MPYVPRMAYHMVSLEPPLAPPTELGSIAAANWCSTANRQGSCSPLKGICLPTNAATLATFKELQRQTNRILAKAGKKLIAVDGRIGPATVNAVADAMAWLGSKAITPEAQAMGLQWANIRGQPCDTIAQAADLIVARIQQVAAEMNYPVVADPRSSQPSQPSSSGGVVHPPPSVIQSSASVSALTYLPSGFQSPIGAAALGIAGLALFKFAIPPAKGKRRRARSTRRTRVRRTRRR